MHDSVKLESAGVPTAVIVQDGFKELALTKRKQMGLEALEPVIIPGQMTSRDVASKKGADAVDDVARWLTRGGSSTGAAEQAQAVAAR